MTTSPTEAGPEVVTDIEPDHWWLGRIWLVVALFAAVTVARSIQVGIPLRDPRHSILVSRLGISAALYVVLSLLDAAWRTPRPGWSISKMVVVLRTRWSRRRLALALSALLAYHFVYFFYHNLKSFNSFNQPQDAMLLSWDRWLFFGHSPGVLLHQLLGVHVAAYVLMVIYESFSALLGLGVVGSLVFVERIRSGYVFIASGICIWILGVGSYYLIPSLGPFQSAPQQFAVLPHTMVQDTQAHYMAERTSLLAHPQANDAFAQVAAFASLHVALTTLLLLMAHYYGLRRTTWFLAFWLVATMIATVYLGWHFAVDDLAGVLIAVLGVALGRWLVNAPRTRGGAGACQGRSGPTATPAVRSLSGCEDDAAT